MCYLNSRYYDPTVGRFLSPDSLEYLEPEYLGGLNLYSYCNNNPVNYYDPSGHIVIGLIIAIVLASTLTVAGGVVGGVIASNNGADGWGIAASVILGMSMGFAVAGLIISVVGVAIHLFASAAFIAEIGITGKELFAIGLLMYNFIAMVVAPIYGIAMTVISYEPNPYKPEKPGETPRHPYNKKLGLGFTNYRKERMYVRINS